MSTILSRINWAGIRTQLAPYNPTYKLSKEYPHLTELKRVSMDANLLPSLLLLTGKRYTPVKNPANGLYSFQRTVDSLAVQEATWDGTSSTSTITKSELAGMLMFLRVSPRGNIMPYKVAQSSSQGSKYGAMTPLILAAWKIHQGINYNEWDWSEDITMRRKLLDDDFAKYSDYFNKDISKVIPWSLEERLAFRKTAYTVAKTGEVKKPEAVTRVSKIYDAKFLEIESELFKHVVVQTWMAVPHLYHPMMIQNPFSLDAPLIDEFGYTGDIFVKEKPTNGTIPTVFETAQSVEFI